MRRPPPLRNPFRRSRGARSVDVRGAPIVAHAHAGANVAVTLLAAPTEAGVPIIALFDIARYDREQEVLAE